jgi:hypothetical protein
MPRFVPAICLTCLSIPARSLKKILQKEVQAYFCLGEVVPKGSRWLRVVERGGLVPKESIQEKPLTVTGPVQQTPLKGSNPSLNLFFDAVLRLCIA